MLAVNNHLSRVSARTALAVLFGLSLSFGVRAQNRTTEAGEASILGMYIHFNHGANDTPMCRVGGGFNLLPLLYPLASVKPFHLFTNPLTASRAYIQERAYPTPSRHNTDISIC